MCGSARRAERISLASASLAKAREAVLLAAMIRPRTDRASRVACRRDQYWYPANAADVSSRTSPLIKTSIAVSFCLIGQSESDISTPRRGHDLGHPQQLGADRQVCRVRRPRVDLEPDTVPVSHEADHASTLGEAVVITHGENRPILETRGNLVQSIAGGIADEQDVTGLDLVDAVIAPNLEGPSSELLTADGLIEKALERVGPQNADDERSLGVGKGRRRPIDELREVEQEDRLHVSLGGLRRLRPHAGGAHQQQRGRDSQKRHATAPYTPRSISRRVRPGAPNST